MPVELCLTFLVYWVLTPKHNASIQPVSFVCWLPVLAIKILIVSTAVKVAWLCKAGVLVTRRVNKLEVIPLEELKRPRVDVVVNCSGVFRDLFVNQMLLLDRAIKLAAEQDEPDEMNFVRKHAKQQAAEMGVNIRDAATRVFSNSSGSYSSNVNLAVENSSWSDESQLQEMYLKRKSFAFNSDRPGAGGEDLTRKSMAQGLHVIMGMYYLLCCKAVSTYKQAHVSRLCLQLCVLVGGFQQSVISAPTCLYLVFTAVCSDHDANTCTMV